MKNLGSISAMTLLTFVAHPAPCSGQKLAGVAETYFRALARPAHQAASVPILNGTSACPANSSASYWDGNSWKPLKQATAIPDGKPPRRGLFASAPMSRAGSDTKVVRYKGATADIVLGSNPKFCFPFPPRTVAQASIGQLDVTGEVRQTTVRGVQINGPFTPFSDSKTFDTTLDTSKAASFEVVSKKPLPPGQYLITNGVAVYDFAVQ